MGDPQPITPAQTVGPFYGFALPYEGGAVVVDGGDVTVHGTVFDGAGEPVPDALIEVLQADPDGGLDGGLFGRCSTAPHGRFKFTTVKPGPTADGCAPHLAVMVHARGLLLQLHTRVYFPDEAANGDDPVLAVVPAERRHTLMATMDDEGYRFDIRLQGGGGSSAAHSSFEPGVVAGARELILEETVFFDV